MGSIAKGPTFSGIIQTKLSTSGRPIGKLWSGHSSDKIVGVIFAWFPAIAFKRSIAADVNALAMAIGPKLSAKMKNDAQFPLLGNGGARNQEKIVDTKTVLIAATAIVLIGAIADTQMSRGGPI